MAANRDEFIVWLKSILFSFESNLDLLVLDKDYFFEVHSVSVESVSDLVVAYSSVIYILRQVIEQLPVEL